MNYSVKLLFSAFFSYVTAACGATVHKQSALYLDELSVHATTFTHQQEYTFGRIIKQRWEVDGAAVTQEIYQQRLDEAYAAERAQEQQQIMRLRERKEEFVLQERSLLLQKLLMLTYQEVVSLRKKLSDIRLQPFITFSPGGIANQQELTELDTVLLPQVQRVCAGLEQADLVLLQQLVRRCDQLPERLQTCYEQTITRARTEASDTKLLKELLEMLAQ